VKLIFSDDAGKDHLYWRQNDANGLERLDDLIGQCQKTPFKGTGKPKPLKGDMAGWWSRRITPQDRLIYRVNGTGSDQAPEIIQCRFHY